MSKKKLKSIKSSDLQLHRRAHFYVSSNVDYRYDLIALLKAHDQRYTQKALTASDSAVYIIDDDEVEFGFSIYEYTRKPSFLKEDGLLVEHLFGVLALVSVKNWLVVYTAGGASWSDTLGDSIRRISGDVVARFLSGASKIQRLGVRNMAITRSSIRAQSYEADDLTSTLPPLGQSRKIVNAVRVMLGDKIFTANPATGMLTESGDSLDGEAYSRWVLQMRNALIKAPAEIGFLGYFARPIKLEDLPKNVHPTGVLLDLEWLRELIEGGDTELRIWRGKECSRVIPLAVVQRAIRIFGEVAEVKIDPEDGEWRCVEYAGLPGRFSIKLRRGNKVSYALQERRLEKIKICNTRTGKQDSVAEALKAQQCVQLAMSNIEYAYAYGGLFRDERIRAQVGVLRGSISSFPVLGQCLSEKGEKMVAGKKSLDDLPSDATVFHPRSIFHAIENDIAAQDEVLICDDTTGDEWADYVGLRFGDPMITLYHAKHGKTGTSASKFQEVLGQAMKNLGRLSVTEGDVESKGTSWGAAWRTTHLKLARVRRSVPGMLPAQAYATLSAGTSTKKRVCVVVTFVSREGLHSIIDDVSQGREIDPHQTQLVLLLVAFISACREMGAEAVLMCPDMTETSEPTGTTKATAAKTGATKTGATKPGAAKTATAKTEATKTAAPNPAATKPGAAKTATTKTEAPKPAAMKLAAPKKKLMKTRSAATTLALFAPGIDENE